MPPVQVHSQVSAAQEGVRVVHSSSPSVTFYQAEKWAAPRVSAFSVAQEPAAETNSHAQRHTGRRDLLLRGLTLGAVARNMGFLLSST